MSVNGLRSLLVGKFFFLCVYIFEAEVQISKLKSQSNTFEFEKNLLNKLKGGEDKLKKSISRKYYVTDLHSSKRIAINCTDQNNCV